MRTGLGFDLNLKERVFLGVFTKIFLECNNEELKEWYFKNEEMLKEVFGDVLDRINNDLRGVLTIANQEKQEIYYFMKTLNNKPLKEWNIPKYIDEYVREYVKNS